MLFARVFGAEVPAADVAFVGEVTLVVGLLVQSAVVDVVLVPVVGREVAFARVAIRHFVVELGGLDFQILERSQVG